MAFSFDKLCSNLIPTGKYKVQVTDIKFRISQTGENTKDMVVTYTIVDGPYAKRTIVDTIYEKTYSFRLKPFLVACKVDMNREFATAEELYRFGLSATKLKILMIDIGVRAYNGKDYNQISNFYPLPDSTTSATDVADELGVVPFVKGDSLGIEETPVPGTTSTETPSEEPKLDINFDDDETF